MIYAMRVIAGSVALGHAIILECKPGGVRVNVIKSQTIPEQIRVWIPEILGSYFSKTTGNIINVENGIIT